MSRGANSLTVSRTFKCLTKFGTCSRTGTCSSPGTCSNTGTCSSTGTCSRTGTCSSTGPGPGLALALALALAWPGLAWPWPWPWPPGGRRPTYWGCGGGSPRPGRPKADLYPGWCLSKTKGLGPSGVLPLNAPRRVSMDEESFSPYTLFLVPIVKN